MNSSLVGVVVGFVLISYSIFSGGSVSAFLDIKSILIVVGGTLSATVASYPFEQLKNITKVIKALGRQSALEAMAIIELLVGYAEKARREGLLSLEDDVGQMDEPFLQKGVQLIVDGTDPELVRSILETELSFLEDRHRGNAAMFETMATFAPAFGMLGTLIGLIQMLRNLEDPSSIGSGMAVALVTTFYGSLLANLLFQPVANRLRGKSKEETLLKEVMIEGILSIQAGENPRIVEEKLKAFLAPTQNSAEPATAADEMFTVSRNG